MYTDPESLSAKVRGLGVFKYSSPAAVTHNDNLYAFWNGISDDGLWYAQYDGGRWSPQIQVLKTDVAIAKNTSPAAVSFNGVLYLFWNAANGNGTRYATLEGNNWNGPISIKDAIPAMAFAPETSPAASVFGDTIQLFWAGSQGNVIYGSSFEKDKWSAQTNINNQTTGIYLSKGTSPATTVFDNKVWLFWNGNDTQANPRGSFYVQYTKQAGWTPAAVSVRDETSGEGAYGSKTSPVALNIKDKFLKVFWTGAAYEKVYATTYTVPGRWTGKQESLDVTSGGVLNNSSAAASYYSGAVYLFWTTPGQDIDYSWDDSSK